MNADADPDESNGLARSARPGWGWSIATATLVVGIVAFFFPLAPFWTLWWLLALVLVLRLSPIGARWIETQRTALLADLVTHSAVVRHPRLVAVAVFVLPTLLAPGVIWDLSDPVDRWNGGALWAMAVFGFLVRTLVEELRRAGHRARWWITWLAATIAIGTAVLWGLPAHVRWDYCRPLLTDAVNRAVGDIDDGVRWCWDDAEVRVVDDEIRLYTDTIRDDGQPSDAGSGLVFSTDGSIVTAGGIRTLVDLGGGWYWFETGSPLRDYWFDG